MQTYLTKHKRKGCLFCSKDLGTNKRPHAKYCSKNCKSKAGSKRMAERQPDYEKKRYRNRLKRDPDLVSKQVSTQRTRHRSDPRLLMLKSAKRRAIRQGVPFNLTLETLGPLPDTCPVFGIKLQVNNGKVGPNSPSLDKIIPELGYVPGNVVIVSYRANTLKRDATLEELQTLASFYANLKEKSNDDVS